MRLRHFAAYRGTAADHQGHVVICDLRGDEVAGPFDLDAADEWLNLAKVDSIRGTIHSATKASHPCPCALCFAIVGGSS